MLVYNLNVIFNILIVCHLTVCGSLQSDGAAALVLVSGAMAHKLGLKVVAKIRGYADAAQVCEECKQSRFCWVCVLMLQIDCLGRLQNGLQLLQPSQYRKQYRILDWKHLILITTK